MVRVVLQTVGDNGIKRVTFVLYRTALCATIPHRTDLNLCTCRPVVRDSRGSTSLGKLLHHAIHYTLLFRRHASTCPRFPLGSFKEPTAGAWAKEQHTTER